jgi:TonB family protein
MRILRLAIFILVIELHVLAIVSVNLDIQAVSLKEEEPVRVMKLTDLAEYIPPSPDPLPTAPPVPVPPVPPPPAPVEPARQEEPLTPPEEPAPQEEPLSPPEVSQEETPREETPPDVVVDDIAEVMIEADAEPGERIAENAAAEVRFEIDLNPEDQTAVENGDPDALPAQFSAVAEDEYLPAHRISVLPQFPKEEILGALIYPPAARRSGIEGRVVLELFIDRTGTIRQIDIVQEEPAGRGFGDAARAAFRDILCEPAKANGQNVSARVRYPVSFRLRSR